MAAAHAIADLGALKRSGARIVWLAHNLRPHDLEPPHAAVWDGFYGRAIARLSDGFLTLSPSTVEIVREAFPELSGKPGGFFWHPAYAPADGSTRSSAQDRAELGIDPSRRAVAFVGLLRPYKGVEALAEVVRAIADPALQLIIAGNPTSDDYDAAMRDLAARDPRVRLELGHLPEPVLQMYMRAVDLIVLPFRDYLHSGSLVHALSVGARVLTPATPFSRDLADLAGAGWVETYEPPLTSQQLMEAVGRARPVTPSWLERLTAAQAASDALAFFEALIRPA